MFFRKNTLLFRNAAITHELTHVLAPNGNRFLAEGLAVYAQEHLKGLSAYPNDGEDIHTLAKEFSEQANLSDLDEQATPSSLSVDGLSVREAYLVSGSFVRYLIERYGMKKFRELYALSPFQSYRRNAGSSGRWKDVYKKSLKSLEADWRAMLGKL
ncbi:MAG: hypothetical protein GKS01_15050 [Alphaproteobacteria bacterium]|nr:hypothetical protein [Alphaproteobacteria bacterium]